VGGRALRPVRPGLPRVPRAHRPGALPPSRDGGGDLRPPRGRSAAAEPAAPGPPARRGRRRGPGHRQAARAALPHLHGLHRGAAGGRPAAAHAPTPTAATPTLPLPEPDPTAPTAAAPTAAAPDATTNRAAVPEPAAPEQAAPEQPGARHAAPDSAGPERAAPDQPGARHAAADPAVPQPRTAPPTATPAETPDAVPAPTDVRAERGPDDPSITVTWTATGGGDVEYKVTRLAADGRRHVVGRTRASYLVDGAVAPDSPVPAYEVLARVGPQAAAPVRSAPADPGGIPAVRNLTVSPGGALVFDWPDGVTEAMVVVRGDRPPEAPDDPAATAWKITNMRYQLDGGLVLPTSVARPCHVAVASCRRDGGALVVAPGFGATARVAVG